MRTRLTVLFATLAVAAVAIPSAASAATLYTTSAQKTAVPVGTTFTASATVPIEGEYAFVLYQKGPNPANVCKTASLSYKVTQNSGGVFKATLTAGGNVVNQCFHQMSGLSNINSTLQISGSSVANGANTAWLGSTISNIGWKLELASITAEMFGSLTSATGSPPKNGVFSQQPTAAKAPVSIVLEHAPGLKGCPVVWSGCDPSAIYTLTGAAAAYSLG